MRRSFNAECSKSAVALSCKSPVFRLYYQGICLFGACQPLFFLRYFACYFVRLQG